MFYDWQLHFTTSFTNSCKTSNLLVCTWFTNAPFLNVANVGRLSTVASFLDSVNFSASAITNTVLACSEDSFLNFGFMILQFPHQVAEYCTTTVSLEFTNSCKLSNSNSFILFLLLI